MRKAFLHRFVLKRIARVDTLEMDDSIQSVVHRYGEIFPGWELACVSLPKNDAQARTEQIQRMLAFVQKHDLA